MVSILIEKASGCATPVARHSATQLVTDVMKDEKNDGGSFCWDFIDCPESVRSKCPVYLDKSHKCWEYKDTRCAEILGFTSDCKYCRYYLAQPPGPTEDD